MTYTRNGEFTLEQWLNRVGRFPVATDEQNVMHSQQVQRAKKGELPERTGQRAFKRMVEGNLRLVFSVWKRQFCDRDTAKRFTLELLQEGVIGLQDAVNKFDPTRGIKFSTYAGHWILKSMREFQRDHEKPIRIKGDVHWKAHKAVRLFERTPKLSPEQIEAEMKMPYAKARELARTWLQTAPTSLDQPTFGKGQTEGANLIDFIPDEGTTGPGPEIEAADTIVRKLFEAVLVPPKFQQLILARFEVGKKARQHGFKGFSKRDHCTAIQHVRNMQAFVEANSISLESLMSL